MVDTFFHALITQPSDLLLLQIAVLGFVLVAAWVIQRPLGRLLTTLEARYVQISLTVRFIQVVRRILWPLLARILVGLAIIAFQDRELSHILLTWGAIFLGLWLLYNLLDGLLEANLPAEQAVAWSRKVVLPLLVVVGLLQALGLLDDILTWSLTPRQEIEVTIGSVLIGLGLLAFFIFLSRFVEQYLERIFFPQVNVDRALARALATLLGYSVVAIGAVIVLISMGINLTTLAVVLGGLSVGLGFGLQEIVSNSISGFILMFERSVGPGDVLRIDDTIGVVEQVNIRSVLIRTQDNVELVVPNSKFLSDKVTNMTRSEKKVRIRVSVGVSYNSDPGLVKQALLEATAHPRVLKNPEPTVQFMDFGESSLNFDLLVWTNDAARIVPLASDLRFQIWDSLKRHNLEIPFPQRDLHLRSGWPGLEKAVFKEQFNNSS